MDTHNGSLFVWIRAIWEMPDQDVIAGDPLNVLDLTLHHTIIGVRDGAAMAQGNAPAVGDLGLLFIAAGMMGACM